MVWAKCQTKKCLTRVLFLKNLISKQLHTLSGDWTDCVYSTAVKTCDISIQTNMFCVLCLCCFNTEVTHLVTYSSSANSLHSVVLTLQDVMVSKFQMQSSSCPNRYQNPFKWRSLILLNPASWSLIKKSDQLTLTHCWCVETPLSIVLWPEGLMIPITAF